MQTDASLRGCKWHAIPLDGLGMGKVSKKDLLCCESLDKQRFVKQNFRLCIRR